MVLITVITCRGNLTAFGDHFPVWQRACCSVSARTLVVAVVALAQWFTGGLPF
jgi:hypothetical protein